jgi:hypothetical protein
VETTFQVNGTDMTIEWLKGHWNRYTTPDCPRAIDPLQEAVGLCLTDEEFTQKVHRIVGRMACRHFANLILECSDAVIKAKGMIGKETESPPKNAQPAAPGGPAAKSMAPARTVKRSRIPFERLKDAPEGFFIDLHVHTSPASPCASSSVDEMIAEAKRIGLDGICLTDHNHQWDPKEIETLREKHRFVVLGATKSPPYRGIWWFSVWMRIFRASSPSRTWP